MVNPDGSGRTLLTPDDRFNRDPSVCGDGRYIVYTAYREQKQGIWRMDADGSNPMRIADETFAISPQCSPDGKWVVYLRGPSWAPVRVPSRGQNLQRCSHRTFVEEGYFSQNLPGRKTNHVSRLSRLKTPVSPSASNPYQLKVIPCDGGADLFKFDLPASASAPRWAPDGDAVEYALTRNGVSNIWQQKFRRRTAETDHEF